MDNMNKRDEFKEKLEKLFDEYDAHARVLIWHDNPVVQIFSPDFSITNHQLHRPANTCMFGNSLDNDEHNCALFMRCPEHKKLSGI